MKLSLSLNLVKILGLGLAGSVTAEQHSLPLEKPVAPGGERPNVILILTDDQGFGDIGFNNNPKIRTPNIDRLAREGVRFEQFHVNPVCSPTRASLMTGRYYYRTGVVDTCNGRSMMFPDETTVAQMLGTAGYRTGIFGKWHLGDNHPMRAMDKGFQESLVMNGGGLAQGGDAPFEISPNGAYFDPWLQHNGEWTRTKGYITDVLTDAALAFIEKKTDQPFFIYLPYNAPHIPLQVPEKYYAHYKDADLRVPQTGGHPVPKFDHETTARVYAMVECLDDNIGRLLNRLDQLKLAENTVVIFMSDNGPEQMRYNGGQLDLKHSTHEGGIRVPFFAYWPGHFRAGQSIDRLTAHIDVLPTLLDLCRAEKPEGVKLDGLSLLPLLTGNATNWPDRTIYFQWHRGDMPEMNRACAAISQQYKLVQPKSAFRLEAGQSDFELYNREIDPLEMNNIAAPTPDVVMQMRRDYEAWFKDVTGARDYTVPPRIYIGAPEQKNVLLTRQDWRVQGARWTPVGAGYWQVDVRRAGDYKITLRFEKTKQPSTAKLTLADVRLQQKIPAGETIVVLPKIHLPKGPAMLEAVLGSDSRQTGMRSVEVTSLE
ncbi:MAG: arylsulfatase [Kiritimatiellaceae bacterium]|nr:arylsulfatase [Kiritimatiellaceae bacterium]